MAIFVGTSGGNDTANASSGVLNGFTGGSVAELQDTIGDTFNCLGGNDFVFAGDGGDSIDGGDGNDRLSGNGGVDTVIGGAGNDQLDGGAGFDRLRGGLGNDTYVVNAQGEADETGGDGIDLVLSTTSYSLSTNLENLTLLGNLNFNASGNGLNNRLIGNIGNNSVFGGFGRDVMTGNAGFDQFVFGILTESGLTAATRDVITDFDAGTNLSTVDRIAVNVIDADATLDGNQSFIFGGPFTAGHIRAVQSGANVLLKFNTDADAAPEMTILLQNVLLADLNGGDFAL